jgi:cephalosporin hydroxylase
MPPTEMTEQESQAWRPELVGWSSDILPYYSRITEQLPAGAVIVEVGVAHGRSLLFMAEMRCELEKEFEIVGVDMNPKPPALKHVTGIRYIQSHSAKAKKWFEDGSVDFVFIDAGHDYDSVKADIAAWLPKVRSGGIIAGHDHEPNEFPGVVQAVAEAFGGRHTMEGRTIWQYRIPEHGDHG